MSTEPLEVIQNAKFRDAVEVAGVKTQPFLMISNQNKVLDVQKAGQALIEEAARETSFNLEDGTGDITAYAGALRAQWDRPLSDVIDAVSSAVTASKAHVTAMRGATERVVFLCSQSHENTTMPSDGTCNVCPFPIVKVRRR
jgi:hypothetical protein